MKTVANTSYICAVTRGSILYSSLLTRRHDELWLCVSSKTQLGVPAAQRTAAVKHQEIDVHVGRAKRRAQLILIYLHVIVTMRQQQFSMLICMTKLVEYTHTIHSVSLAGMLFLRYLTLFDPLIQPLRVVYSSILCDSLVSTHPKASLSLACAVQRLSHTNSPRPIVNDTRRHTSGHLYSCFSLSLLCYSTQRGSRSLTDQDG